MPPTLKAGTYFGENGQYRKIGWLTLSESRYRPNQFIPEHDHESAFFYLVVEGACTELGTCDDGPLGPRHLLFHREGAVHANRWHPDGGRCLHIEIAPARLEEIRTYADLPEDRTRYDSGLPAWLADRLYREFLAQDEASALAIEGLALEVLAAASRQRSPAMDLQAPRWLQSAREFLRDQCSEEISLQALAQSVQVHPAHLARAFRRHFHCTVGEYLRQCRVDTACQQLVNTGLPLREIALNAGFYDQSHFANTFKRRIGMTPLEFRCYFGKCNSDPME